MKTFQTLAFVALFSAAQAQAAPAFSQLFVFGDSLSDNGNDFLALGGHTVTTPPFTSLVPSAPYASGTFSNGPVWVNFIDQALTGGTVSASLAGGTNFAFGGATTGPLAGVPASGIPTLTQQADAALALNGGHLPSTALYVVWGGGNDVRAAEFAAGANPNATQLAAAGQIVAGGVTNLHNIITALANAGAQHFLVPNVANVGLTPEALSFGLGSTGATLTSQFDVSLAQQLPQLASSLHVGITAVDIFSIVNNEHDHPGTFGLTNVTAACTQQNSGLGCATPDQFLFWDGIHPTSLQHQGIAAVFSSALAVPLPAAVWLLGSALGGLSFARRRAA